MKCSMKQTIEILAKCLHQYHLSSTIELHEITDVGTWGLSFAVLNIPFSSTAISISPILILQIHLIIYIM